MLEGYPLRKYRLTDWLVLLLTSTLVLQVLVTFLSSKVIQIFPSLILDSTRSETEILSQLVYLSTFVGTVLSLPLTLIAVHWREIPLFNRKRLNKQESFLIRGLNKEDWRFLVKYIPSSYVVYLLGNGLVITLFGEAEAINQLAVESMFEYIPAWQMFIMIVVVAPIVEELVFRGLVLFSGDKIKTSWFRVLISALLFGLIHGPTNIQSFYTYVGMGVILAYAGKRTQSVEGPMIYHFLNNLVGFISILSLQ